MYNRLTHWLARESNRDEDLAPTQDKDLRALDRNPDGLSIGPKVDYLLLFAEDRAQTAIDNTKYSPPQDDPGELQG